MRVARFVFWRTLRGVLTLLTMIALTFAFYFAIERQPPLQFFYSQIGRGVPATPQQIAAGRHVFYLDRSKVGLYLDYVGHLARGDFGRFMTIDTQGKVVDAGPVGPQFFAAMRATLAILIGGGLFVVLLSLPLGAISGSRIGSWRDRIISFAALVLVCMHPMMLGLILRSAGQDVHWLPTTGYCPLLGHMRPTSGFGAVAGPSCGGVGDWTLHLLLPWLTFALLFLALYTRMVRARVSQTIDEDFVRTARAKGASQARILGRHVLPFASLGVLTMVGMEIGTAIGVCIYIESVFSIPGLGTDAVNTLAGNGPFLILPAALAVVVLLTLIVVVGNLVVDALYAVLDPRVGAGGSEGGRSKSLVGGVF